MLRHGPLLVRRITSKHPFIVILGPFPVSIFTEFIATFEKLLSHGHPLGRRIITRHPFLVILGPFPVSIFAEFIATFQKLLLPPGEADRKCKPPSCSIQWFPPRLILLPSSEQLLASTKLAGPLLGRRFIRKSPSSNIQGPLPAPIFQSSRPPFLPRVKRITKDLSSTKERFPRPKLHRVQRKSSCSPPGSADREVRPFQPIIMGHFPALTYFRDQKQFWPPLAHSGEANHCSALSFYPGPASRLKSSQSFKPSGYTPLMEGRSSCSSLSQSSRDNSLPQSSSRSGCTLSQWQYYSRLSGTS